MNQLCKIVFVDPDPGQFAKLASLLDPESYRLFHASTFAEGLRLASTEMPHLLITELEINGKDGIDLCMEIRENSMLDGTLVVILSSREENFAQIAALNAGADDYLIKPVSSRLLQSKVRSLFRRISLNGHFRNQQVGDLRVDRDRFVIICQGEEIPLPPKEFEILSLLVSQPRRVFTRDEIKREVWELPQGVRNRTIDVHIRKLREKVGGRMIKTVKGVGYKLEN